MVRAKAGRKNGFNRPAFGKKPDLEVSGLTGVNKAKDNATIKKILTKFIEDPLVDEAKHQDKGENFVGSGDATNKGAKKLKSANKMKKDNIKLDVVAPKKQEKTPKCRSRTITGSGTFIVTPTSQSSKKGNISIN